MGEIKSSTNRGARTGKKMGAKDRKKPRNSLTGQGQLNLTKGQTSARREA